MSLPITLFGKLIHKLFTVFGLLALLDLRAETLITQVGTTITVPTNQAISINSFTLPIHPEWVKVETANGRQYDFYTANPPTFPMVLGPCKITIIHTNVGLITFDRLPISTIKTVVLYDPPGESISIPSGKRVQILSEPWIVIYKTQNGVEHRIVLPNPKGTILDGPLTIKADQRAYIPLTYATDIELSSIPRLITLERSTTGTNWTPVFLNQAMSEQKAFYRMGPTR